MCEMHRNTQFRYFDEPWVTIGVAEEMGHVIAPTSGRSRIFKRRMIERRETDDRSHSDRARSKTAAGDRSFAVAGPRLWNSLPTSIISAGSLAIFKKQLKTFLFRTAYD